MKHFILGLRITFYISALLFFNNDVRLFTALALINILLLESIYYSFLPVLLILFLPLPYKILLIGGYICYLVGFILIRKNKYYSSFCYFIIASIILISMYFLKIISYQAILIALIWLLVIFIISYLFMFAKKNKKYIIAPINEELIQGIILLTYLLGGLFYKNNNIYFSLLFIELYLNKRTFYNLVFIIIYIIYNLIFKALPVINILGYTGISFIPPLAFIGLKPTEYVSYLVLVYSIIISSIKLFNLKLELPIKNSNIEYFKEYIKEIKDEYSRLITINSLKKNAINRINEDYCLNCKLITPCKNKPDIRNAFLSEAIALNNNNIYNCPNYKAFYINNSLIAPEATIELTGIEILVDELDDILGESKIDKAIFHKLFLELAFYGYKPIGLLIYKKYKSTFFKLTFTNIEINKELLLKLTTRLFKEELDIKVINNDKLIDCYIYRKPKIKLNYSEKIIAMDNNYVCGDNFMVKRDYNDCYIFILSDGMGNGHRAYLESTKTIKLTEKLINNPFSTDVALKMLKSIYSIKSEYDSYATLDLLIINTTRRIINLYKMGSTTTFIYHENKLTHLENKALPMELDDINSSYELEIYKDDIIILASDGITDYINDEELILILNNNYVPEVIEDKIINTIKRKEGTLKDDASLIVIQIY